MPLHVIGMKRLLRNLENLQKLPTPPQNVEIMRAAARPIRDKAKENVRAKLSRNSRGKLEGSIRIVAVNQWQVKVGPQGVVYANIHEFGGEITPKNAAALHFWIDGEEVFAQRVYIPARPYMRPAVESERDASARAAAKKAEELVNDLVE